MKKKKVDLSGLVVGLKCFDNKFGCNCTVDVEEGRKQEFYDGYGVEYDDCCYYTIVFVENPDEITLEDCLRQQQATEYENAVEIWSDFDVICEMDNSLLSE